MIGPLPDILEQPVIPPPLHGVNPRLLMGKAAWDVERRKIYRKYGFTCAACGVHAREAFPVTRLEAHERFRVDYRKRQMVLIGMEPVCPACHAFVHAGLLELRVKTGRIERPIACRILDHGLRVLRESGGRVPPAAHHLCRALGVRQDRPVSSAPPRTPWAGWQMIWNDQCYPSPYATEEDWRKSMGLQDKEAKA